MERLRLVPILTAEQRAWVDECKNAVASKKHSLIPADVIYKVYRKQFEYRCKLAGINKCHGLRHLYAQSRFFELAGFQCPVKGGPTKKTMTLEQQQSDFTARLRISQDLGHSRASILKSYCN
jgi:hypothetical protein